MNLVWFQAVKGKFSLKNFKQFIKEKAGKLNIKIYLNVC